MVQVEPTSSVPNTLGNPVGSHCPAVGGTVESYDCKVQRTSRTAILVVILAFFLLTRKQTQSSVDFAVILRTVRVYAAA